MLPVGIFQHEVGHYLSGRAMGRNLNLMSLGKITDPITGQVGGAGVLFHSREKFIPKVTSTLEDIASTAGSLFTEMHLDPKLNWIDNPQLKPERIQQIQTHISGDAQEIENRLDSLFMSITGRLKDGRPFLTPKDWIANNFTTQQLAEWKQVIQDNPDQAKQRLKEWVMKQSVETLEPFFKNEQSREALQKLRSSMVTHLLDNPKNPAMSGAQVDAMEKATGLSPYLGKVSMEKLAEPLLRSPKEFFA